MAVSYLVSLEELTVIAYFCGYARLTGFSHYPEIGRERCEALIKDLSRQGMLSLNDEEVSVEPSLNFVVDTMAGSALSVRTADGVLGYCTRSLGVLLSRAPHSVKKYRIMPVPSAYELAERLWAEDEDGVHRERKSFTLYDEDKSWKQAALTKNELESFIAKIYTEGAEIA